MTYLYRVVFVLLMFVGFVFPTNGQDLEYLPPVITRSINKDTVKALLLNTIDSHHDFNVTGTKSYISSVQIIEAGRPWPPIWYTATPVYTDQMFTEDSIKHKSVLNILIDAKVEGGYLSFFKEIAVGMKDSLDSRSAKPVSGYILLNKQMEPVDTVMCKTHDYYIYGHDLRINAKGERLVDFKAIELLDLRARTGHSQDSAVRSQVDYIHILDRKNNPIFSWIATDHLDPNVFEFEATLHSKSLLHNFNEHEFIDWSHLTSVVWDYDDNILYALRYIGIGKISKLDGHVVWHIDYNDLPIISGKDTIEWFSPHDFKLLYDNDSSAIYSVYSCGTANKPGDSGTTRNARVIIFELSKKTNKIKLVRYLNPAFSYVATGQGGCDYRDSNNYIISYGHGVNNGKYVNFENFCNAFEWRRNDSILTIYQLPQYVAAWKVHELRDWPLPQRPKIVFKDDALEAIGDMTEWTWYKLSGPDNIYPSEVGHGKKISPQSGCTYCVVGKYGIGYCVSLPFVCIKKPPLTFFLITALGTIFFIFMVIRYLRIKHN